MGRNFWDGSDSAFVDTKVAAFTHRSKGDETANFTVRRVSSLQFAVVVMLAAAFWFV
jgi:hypothetical protein